MTTSEECEVCHMPGMMCSHRADLNRAMAMFSGEGRSPNGGLHEFQFFGDGGADSWLVNGPGYGVAAVLEETSLPAEPSFKYMDFLRNTCDPARLTFDVSSSTPTDSSDSTSRSRPKEASAVVNVAPTSMMSFSGNGTFTNPPNSNVKEADKPAASVEGEAMDREARVLRYREKKKRRKFEKQIRYASRKAYAEMRPRVKGRFAKVPDMSQPSVPASYNPSQLGMGWYQP